MGLFVLDMSFILLTETFIHHVVVSLEARLA